MAGMVMSAWTSSSCTFRPVKEKSPSSGDWKSWNTASSPTRFFTLARAMLPLKKKISATLSSVLGDDQVARLVRADEGLDDGGQVEEAEVALELLARALGHLQGRGLQPPRQDQAEVPGEGGQARHQVQEDRPSRA